MKKVLKQIINTLTLGLLLTLTFVINVYAGSAENYLNKLNSIRDSINSYLLLLIPLAAIVIAIMYMAAPFNLSNKDRAKVALYGLAVGTFLLFTSSVIVGGISELLGKDANDLKSFTLANDNKQISSVRFAGTFGSSNHNSNNRSSNSSTSTTTGGGGNSSGGSLNASSSDTGVIFIGDSRTDGLKDAVSEQSNEFFVCKIGAGFSWFDTAVSEANSIISSHPEYTKWIILSNLGVNSALDSPSGYISNCNQLLNGQWSSYNFYLVSVNPVIDGKTSVLNLNVTTLNTQLRISMPKAGYIDTYSTVSSLINASTCPDGLHYDNTIYQKIYDIMEQSIRS